MIYSLRDFGRALKNTENPRRRFLTVLGQSAKIDKVWKTGGNFVNTERKLGFSHFFE